MQIIFDLIFFVKTGAWICWLGKEVGNIVGAAEFQANDVIDFVLARLVTGDAVFGIDLVFGGSGNVAHRRGIARLANLGGGGIG